MRANFAIWICQQVERSDTGLERPNDIHQVPENGPQIMFWCAKSEKELIGLYVFETRNGTEETY